VAADVADDLHPLLPQLISMDEARLAALDKRIAADLEIGRHQELACELAGLVAANPRRERFRAHQMLAFYRTPCRCPVQMMIRTTGQFGGCQRMRWRL
jgi:hypothetical protein